MRIGVFGGTFDPVHLGHLILAEQCREQARLDLVLFIPAARPPHKSARELTPFSQRVEMLSLAIAGQPAFRVEELEKDRPGPSFTVDTLQQIKVRHPDADLFLLLGSDSLVDLPNWHDPAGITKLAELLVVPRPEVAKMAEEEMRQALTLAGGGPIRLQMITLPGIGISSRDLRRRSTEGKTLRYLVPRAVEAYLHDKKLYQQSS